MIICGYFCIGFIEFTLKCQNNIKIFSITKKIEMKKIYCVICGKYRKFKNPKIPYIFKKPFVLSII